MAFVDIKCLESLLIEGEELSIANEKLTWIEDNAKNVSYFGKKLNCNVYIHVPEERINEAKAALNKFISASNSLSTKYESWMINQIKNLPWLDDLIEGKDIPETISKYNDIPDLTLGDIEVATTYRTKKIVVIISGGYAIDEEHGWAIAFINNKPVGNLSESGSIHNEYANESVNTIKSEITAVFTKSGKLGRLFIPKSDSAYQYLAEFIQNSTNPNKLTNDDIIKLHSFYYDESLALKEFAPSKEPQVVKIIKKYKPVPIYSMGNGDFIVLYLVAQLKNIFMILFQYLIQNMLKIIRRSKIGLKTFIWIRMIIKIL